MAYGFEKVRKSPVTISFIDFPCRWVYRRSFVADGNFKADHVRQKDTGVDIWLSEGGGMIPNRSDYQEFIRSARERRTVC
jgi:hypothetical protein